VSSKVWLFVCCSQLALSVFLCIIFFRVPVDKSEGVVKAHQKLAPEPTSGISSLEGQMNKERPSDVIPGLDRQHQRENREDAERVQEVRRERGLLQPGVKAGAIVAWLKRDFGLGQGHAMAIYATFEGG
jgi:hypothetical protein